MFQKPRPTGQRSGGISLVMIYMLLLLNFSWLMQFVYCASRPQYASRRIEPLPDFARFYHFLDLALEAPAWYSKIVDIL